MVPLTNNKGPGSDDQEPPFIPSLEEVNVAGEKNTVFEHENV